MALDGGTRNGTYSAIFRSCSRMAHWSLCSIYRRLGNSTGPTMPNLRHDLVTSSQAFSLSVAAAAAGRRAFTDESIQRADRAMRPVESPHSRSFGLAGGESFINITELLGSESDRRRTTSLSPADYISSEVSLTVISDPSYLAGISTVNLPASSRHLFYSDGTSNLESPRDAISSRYAYDPSREAIAAPSHPPSGRHPARPDWQQALSHNHIVTATRYLYNSVVNNQNITQLPVTNPRVEGQPLFNLPRLTETFLSITSQAGLAMLAIRTGGSTSLSRNATILFDFAAACNVFGFLSCLFAILIRDRYPRIASIVRGTGFLCTAYGFLAIMAMLLDDNIMLWVSILAFIVSLPALASAFIA